MKATSDLATGWHPDKARLPLCSSLDICSNGGGSRVAWLVEAVVLSHIKALTSIPSASLLRRAITWDLLCDSLVRMWLQGQMGKGTEGWGTHGRKASAKGSTHWVILPPTHVLYQGASLNNSFSFAELKCLRIWGLGFREPFIIAAPLWALEGIHKKTKSSLPCHNFGGFIFSQPKKND